MAEREAPFDVSYPHSYEAFAARPPILKVDLQTLEKISAAHNFLDWGCGPGYSTGRLLLSGKVISPYTITGVDIDEKALAVARKNFGPDVREIKFLKVEQGEPLDFDGPTFDRAIGLNMIHNAGAEFVLGETYRLLQPRGEALFSSAYGELSYPEGTSSFWGGLVVFALRDLREKGVIDKTQKPEPLNLFKYKDDDYERIAKELGFVDIASEYIRVPMDLETIRAICFDGEFANGAFRGLDIDTDIASRALMNAAEPAYARVKDSILAKYDVEEGVVPRDWKIFFARRAA